MIELSSGKLIVKKILKKTKAKLFCDLIVGDIIEITVSLIAPGGNRSTYAKTLLITKEGSIERSRKTFNELPKILDCFELEKEFF